MVAKIGVKEITGNDNIENAAIQFVMDREKAEGREAQDTRKIRGAVADLKSGDRIIEVKAAGKSARGFDVWLERRQFEAAKNDPEHFWVYLVENVRQGNPEKFRLLRLGGQQLLTAISHAKEQKSYLLPLPTAVFDQLASEDAPGTIATGPLGADSM